MVHGRYLDPTSDDLDPDVSPTESLHEGDKETRWRYGDSDDTSTSHLSDYFRYPRRVLGVSKRRVSPSTISVWSFHSVDFLVWYCFYPTYFIPTILKSFRKCPSDSSRREAVMSFVLPVLTFSPFTMKLYSKDYYKLIFFTRRTTPP